MGLAIKYRKHKGILRIFTPTQPKNSDGAFTNHSLLQAFPFMAHSHYRKEHSILQTFPHNIKTGELGRGGHFYRGEFRFHPELTFQRHYPQVKVLSCCCCRLERFIVGNLLPGVVLLKLRGTDLRRG